MVSILRTIHEILRKWHLLVYPRVWKRDNTSDIFLTSKSSERKEKFRKVILKIFWEQQRAIKNTGKIILLKKSMLRSKKSSIWIYGVFSCCLFSWAGNFRITPLWPLKNQGGPYDSKNKCWNHEPRWLWGKWYPLNTFLIVLSPLDTLLDRYGHFFGVKFTQKLLKMASFTTFKPK